MASLGLKIYYLRTREKRISQREVAAALGVRQATISYVENDVTAPQWALLVNLCRFFDVTPTFLADERRGVVPHPTERWGLRDALATVGMWVEVSAEGMTELGDGRWLCKLEPGAGFYDDEAARVRERYKRPSALQGALEQLQEEHTNADRELERELKAERNSHGKRRRS